MSLADVASQREDKGWTLQSWAEYYNKPAAEREKIRNVISLEISETKLAEKIMPPRLVRELDWVEQAWPASKRKGAGTYPKVQMYCLMSVAECWTVRRFRTRSHSRMLSLLSQDWHLDFAGTSVYYHILKGSKVGALQCHTRSMSVDGFLVSRYSTLFDRPLPTWQLMKDGLGATRIKPQSG